MSVIRNRHNRKNNFVILDKKPLWDKELSLKAIGLWARCISRPDDWEFSIRELEKSCKEKEVALYGAIKELREAKLCLRVQQHWVIRKDGVVHKGAGPVVYVLMEVPASDEELKILEKEIRQDYETMLRMTGHEFYVPLGKKNKSNNFYMEPQNLDPCFLDPGNQDKLRNHVTKKKEDQETDAAPCSQKKEFKKSSDAEVLEGTGLERKQVLKLCKSFPPEKVLESIEFMKSYNGIIPNPYGWVKKCCEEDWVLKDKEKTDLAKKTWSIHYEFAKKVEEKYSSKLKTQCAFQLEKTNLTIIRGTGSIIFEYSDKNFLNKLEKELRKMGLNK